jgi:hypothetical protein
MGAINLAVDFLSERSIAWRGGIPGTRRKGSPVALPHADSPFIPGNHDVWAGWFPLILDKPCAPRDQISCYTKLYQEAAPGADRIDDEPFPYRRLLFENEEVVLRLYGLDSTRMDLAPQAEVSVLRAAGEEVQRNTGLSQDAIAWLRRFLFAQHTDDELRRAVASVAVGFMDEPQMVRLLQFVEQEREEFQDSKRRLIRIAMIHHPIAFKNTPSNQSDWNPDPLRGLLRLGLVQALLQSEQFFAVLCGHQHRGFVQSVRPDPGRPPLYVLSVGTSGQKINLSIAERRLIRRPKDRLTQEEADKRIEILDQLNEYAIYELSRNENGIYIWSVCAARHLPQDAKFVFQSKADMDYIPVSFVNHH